MSEETQNASSKLEEERKEKAREKFLLNMKKYKEKKQKTKEFRRKQAQINFQKNKKEFIDASEPIGIAARSDRVKRVVVPTKMSPSFVNYAKTQENDDSELLFLNKIKAEQCKSDTKKDDNDKENKKTLEEELLLTISSLVSNEMPVINISSVLEYYTRNSHEGTDEEIKIAIDKLVNEGKLFRYKQNVSLNEIK